MSFAISQDLDARFTAKARIPGASKCAADAVPVIDCAAIEGYLAGNSAASAHQILNSASSLTSSYRVKHRCGCSSRVLLRRRPPMLPAQHCSRCSRRSPHHCILSCGRQAHSPAAELGADVHGYVRRAGSGPPSGRGVSRERPRRETPRGASFSVSTLRGRAAPLRSSSAERLYFPPARFGGRTCGGLSHIFGLSVACLFTSTSPVRFPPSSLFAVD